MAELSAPLFSITEKLRVDANQAAIAGTRDAKGELGGPVAQQKQFALIHCSLTRGLLCVVLQPVAFLAWFQLFPLPPFWK